ncbi:MAG: hypothetical protein EAX86_12185 [Candidatus Heimdallarchaeota archaeon]|nr:hypothetical protein [Candidatus Heimdallarchaeota archaeon]
MTNCEKCGKPIRDGLVFCDTCAGRLETKKPLEARSSTSIAASIIDDDTIFTYKRKHSSNIVRIYRILPYLFTLIAVIIGVDLLNPDLIPIAIVPEASVLALVFLGLIFILILYRGSKQERYIYLSMLLLVLTIGTGTLLPELQGYIFTVGILLVGVSLVYRILTKINKDIGLNLGLIIIIFILSLAILFPDFSSIILAVGVFLSSIFLLIARH